MIESGTAHGVTVEQRGPVLYVHLDRPEVHNALDGNTITRLRDIFLAVPDGGKVRALVLAGAGKSFCAGADLAWMRALAGMSRTEHAEDARRLFDMLAALNSCAVPSVARVHGVALGGGMGLVAACDIAIAAADARFGFTEAKLGLLPAVISPFCVAKIGPSHARALFATAERFDARRALQIGLVHHVVPPDALDATVDDIVRELLTSAPGAAAHARQLVREVAWRLPGDTRDYTVEINARRRASAEGQEGMAAFLEKRSPSWVQPPRDGDAHTPGPKGSETTPQ